MKRNSKSSLAMLSIILLTSMLVSSFIAIPSKAVDYTKVGVKVGDWAYYSYDTNSTGLFPAGTTNTNMTVTNISASNVTARLVFYYPNGTISSTAGLQGNITSGQYNTTAPVLGWFLVVPNLTKDDPVYSGAPYKINGTGKIVAGGKARAYVYANVTVGGGFQRAYFDQATGIADLFYALFAGGGHHYYVRWSLVSTSLWSPPSYRVGVNVEDWAYYSVQQGDNSGSTGVTNANITIVRVDRGNVTILAKAYYANGTTSSSTMWGNVSSGASSPGVPFVWYLLAANLTKDDPIWGNSSPWINDTVTLAIFGRSRVCNHLFSTVGGAKIELYWDQVTGITTRLNASSIGMGGAYLKWNMTSTSLWSPAPSPPELPLSVLIVVGGIAVVAVVAGIIVLRKRRK